MNIVYKMPLLTLGTVATLHFVPWLTPQLSPFEIRRAGLMMFWGFVWWIWHLGSRPGWGLKVEPTDGGAKLVAYRTESKLQRDLRRIMKPSTSGTEMARYAEAIEWLAYNEDTSEIDNTYDEPSDVAGFAPVTVVMVADLFGKDIEQVIIDLRKFQLKLAVRDVV